MQIQVYNKNQLLQSKQLNDSSNMSYYNMIELLRPLCTDPVTHETCSAVIGSTSFTCVIKDNKTILVNAGYLVSPIDKPDFYSTIYYGNLNNPVLVSILNSDFYIVAKLDVNPKSTNVQVLDSTNNYNTSNLVTSYEFTVVIETIPVSKFTESRYTSVLYKYTDKDGLIDMRRIVLSSSQSSLSDNGITTITRGQLNNITSVNLKPLGGLRTNGYNGISIDDDYVLTTGDSTQVKKGTLVVSGMYVTNESTEIPTSPSNAVVTKKDVDSILSTLTERVKSLEVECESKIGSIVYFPTTTLPTGWLRLHGDVILTSLYPKLTKVVDSTWIVKRATDATQVIKLPDLRGYFVRCASESSGRDPDIASRTLLIPSAVSKIGSSQQHQIVNHSHSYPTSSDLSHGGGARDKALATSGGHNNNAGTWGAGGSETRPINVYLVPAIYVGLVDYNKAFNSQTGLYSGTSI